MVSFMQLHNAIDTNFLVDSVARRLLEEVLDIVKTREMPEGNLKVSISFDEDRGVDDG